MAPSPPRATSARAALAAAPATGVTYVVAEAAKLGFSNGHPDWANLAQGQPESGPIEGAPPRLDHLHVSLEAHAAGPVNGVEELRERIAAHMNRLYRRGKTSQYTVDNVAVGQGGRLAVARALAPLSNYEVGYVLPDATAYEELSGLRLDRAHALAIRAAPERGFVVSSELLLSELDRHRLSALLLANPANPTGNLIEDADLATLVAGVRERDALLLLDESANQYVWTPEGGAGSAPVSAATAIEDVDEDPVLLFDSLGKNFRYPGWRLGWTVGPAPLIEAIRRSSNALDGGASRLSQAAALMVLEPERADQETHATRVHFAKKRKLMMRRLVELGIAVDAPPRGGFSCWGSVAELPAPFHDGMTFFRKALQYRVLTVPGRFFDAGLEPEEDTYADWVRFSFAASIDQLRMGLDRLAQMLRGE